MTHIRAEVAKNMGIHRNNQFTRDPLPLVLGRPPAIDCNVARSLDIFGDVQAVLDIASIAPQENIIDVLF